MTTKEKLIVASYRVGGKVKLAEKLNIAYPTLKNRIENPETLRLHELEIVETILNA